MIVMNENFLVICQISNRFRKLSIMHSKIYVADSDLGKGVYAKVHIKRWETLFYLTGRLITFQEAVTIPQGEYSVQIGIDRYVDPWSPARYLNHSCAPNVGFRDELRVVALRPISPGEEVRFDYSTTMLERAWEMDCSCGSFQCRKKIQDFDLLPLAQQVQY